MAGVDVVDRRRRRRRRRRRSWHRPRPTADGWRPVRRNRRGMRSMASAVAAVTSSGPAGPRPTTTTRGGTAVIGRRVDPALVVVGPLGRWRGSPAGRIWWLLGSHVPYSRRHRDRRRHARLQELVHGRRRLVGDVLLGRHHHVGLHLLVGQHGDAVDHEHVPAELGLHRARRLARRRRQRRLGEVGVELRGPRAGAVGVEDLAAEGLAARVLGLLVDGLREVGALLQLGQHPLGVVLGGEQDVAHAQLAEAAGVGVVGGLGLGVVDRATAEGVFERDDGGGLGQRPVLEPLREGVEDVGAAGLVEAGQGLGPHRGVVGRPQRSALASRPPGAPPRTGCRPAAWSGRSRR